MCYNLPHHKMHLLGVCPLWKLRGVSAPLSPQPLKWTNSIAKMTNSSATFSIVLCRWWWVWSLANKLINLNYFVCNELQLPTSVSNGSMPGENNLPCDEWLVSCSQCNCDEFLRANTRNSNAKLTNSIANELNFIAKVTNSTVNGTESTAKVTNLIAKTCKVSNGVSRQLHIPHAMFIIHYSGMDWKPIKLWFSTLLVYYNILKFYRQLQGVLTIC